MAPFRFIHTSDLHLGKRFIRYPEEFRGRLIEARHQAIHRIADAARDRRAGHVLVAGDTFDTETPSEQVWRQALGAMGAAAPVMWWIIPGNHDSLAAEYLWAQFRTHAPPNVHLVDAPEPIEIEAGVMLLPAPATHRFPGDDLTAWMHGCATPEGMLRIGLAHGSVMTFGSEDDNAETIPVDRAVTAGLDYLALGDWHGDLRIDARTYYSGAPERDRFRRRGRGVCLAVAVAGSGSVPVVECVEVGQFNWLDIELPLLPKLDAAQALRDALPKDMAARRDTLLRVRPTGHVRLGQHQRLEQTGRLVAPEFGNFASVDSALSIECDEVELDRIGKGGSLRMAAEQLHVESTQAYTKEDRDIAGAALRRLFKYAEVMER